MADVKALRDALCGYHRHLHRKDKIKKLKLRANGYQCKVKEAAEKDKRLNNELVYLTKRAFKPYQCEIHALHKAVDHFSHGAFGCKFSRDIASEGCKRCGLSMDETPFPEPRDDEEEIDMCCKCCDKSDKKAQKLEACSTCGYAHELASHFHYVRNIAWLTRYIMDGRCKSRLQKHFIETALDQFTYRITTFIEAQKYIVMYAVDHESYIGRLEPEEQYEVTRKFGFPATTESTELVVACLAVARRM